jgi:hypothetical protein
MNLVISLIIEEGFRDLHFEILYFSKSFSHLNCLSDHRLDSPGKHTVKWGLANRRLLGSALVVGAFEGNGGRQAWAEGRTVL